MSLIGRDTDADAPPDAPDERHRAMIDESRPTRARRAVRASPQRLALGVMLLALTPVLAVIVTRAGRTYVPTGDPASLDLFVRDVFSAHPPLVGTYSRGFNHPGPMLFWLLGPLSWVTGGAPWATLVGAALLQGVAIVGVGWISFRRAGIAFMLTTLSTLALAYAGFGFGVQFLEAWNPYIAFPFFLLFLLLVWAVAIGDRWQLLSAVVVGSFLVQAHIGYTPLVLGAGLWGLVAALTRGRPADESSLIEAQPPWGRVLTWTEAAFVVVWLPPLLQQLTGERGNLEEIWNFLTANHTTAGLTKAAGILAAEFRVPPPWLDGRDRISFWSVDVAPASLWWLLVPAILLGAGFFAAHRSGRRADRRLVELAAVTAIVSVLALSRVPFALEPFLFFWRITAAVFVVMASAWAVANWLPVRTHHDARTLVSAAMVAVIAIGFGQRVLDVTRHADRVSVFEAIEHDLVTQALSHDPPRSPVLIRALGTTTAGLDQGLIDALDREGAPVRVDPQYGYHFGTQRVAKPFEVREVWYVAQEGRFRSVVSGMPGARVIGSVTPLSPSEEKELVDLQRAVAPKLVAAFRGDLLDALDSEWLGAIISVEHVPGIPPATVERIAQLNQKALQSGPCRCSIIAFPARLAPDLPYTLG